MSLIADRLDKTVDRVGETVSFTKLAGTAGTYSVPAIVRNAESGTVNTFADDTEKMGIARPALFLIFKSASTVQSDDTFSRDGRSFIVFKVFKQRIGADIVSVTALAS